MREKYQRRPVIKIGPVYYSIKFKPNLTNEEGQALYGRIHDASQEIQICPGYSEERTGTTLLHEVIHGISNTYNVGLSEEQVEVLANALYDVLDQAYLFNKESLLNFIGQVE